MNLLAEIIKNISSEKFAELKISKINLQNALIDAIITRNYDLVSDIITKTKINLNFGNDSAYQKSSLAANSLDPIGEIPNPLLTALVYADSQIIMLILNNGADKHIITPRGTNTVHYAIQQNRLALTIYLVRNGVKLDTETVKAASYIKDIHIDGEQFLAFLEEEAAACDNAISSVQGRMNNFMNEKVPNRLEKGSHTSEKGSHTSEKESNTSEKESNKLEKESCTSEKESQELSDICPRDDKADFILRYEKITRNYLKQIMVLLPNCSDESKKYMENIIETLITLNRNGSPKDS